MKKVIKKFNRTLSIMLAAAMVLTMVPQTAMPVLAEETQVVEDQNVDLDTPDTNPDENQEPADVTEADDTDKSDDSDTTDGEQGEDTGDNKTPVMEGETEGENPDVTDNTPEDESTPADENADAENGLFGAEDFDAAPFAANTAYDVVVTNEQGHTVTNAAKTPEDGTAYTFKVKLKDGYKDLQVAAYKGETVGEEQKITVTASEPDESGEYTCTIAGDVLTGIEDGVTKITIVVSATAIPKYTLTIPQASTVDGITKVEYSTDATTWADAPATAPEFEENTEVYVKVTADEGYSYTVKKQYAGDTEAAEATKEADKDYYKFPMTANLTLTITAAEIVTSYEVTLTGVGDSDKAALTWATEDVTVDGSKITVAAGKDLKFKVSVKEADAETTKIDSVKYTIGGGTEQTATADTEGVYTITGKEITGTVAITVTTAPFADYTLAFTYDDTKIAAPVIKVNGAALAEDKWAEASKTATISEKDSVSFTLSPKENSKYVVDEVTFSDTETSDATLDAQADGSYLLGKLNGNTTVTVTDKLDEEKANRLTLAAAEGGNARGYSVTFKQADGSALDGVSETFQNGGKIVTLTDEFYALIKPGKGFQLESAAGTAEGVTVAKVEEAGIPSGITVAEGEQLYKITYTKAAALELKVKATAIPSTQKQTVLFSNKSARLTYALKDENIQQDGNKKNTYVVPAGSTAFDFSIDALIGYQPVVSYVNEDDESVTVTPNGEGVLTGNRKAKTFNYSLAVGELPDNTVITMQDEPAKQAVKVTYDSNDIEIQKVRIGAKEYTGDTDSADNDDETVTETYLVPHGETLTFTVTAQDNCKIVKTVTNTGRGAKTDTKAKTTFEASFKADATAAAAQTLVVESAKNYAGTLKDTTSNRKVDPVKNVYTVDFDHTYTVSAYHGNSGAIELSKVLVKAKRGGAAVEGVTATANDENKKAYSFTINDKAVTAKDLVVELYAKGNDTDTADVSLALTVRPVLTKVTVTGVKNGAVEQTVDTTKTYAVKVDPKTASNAELYARIDPVVAGFSASYDNATGKLSVTTSQTLDATATVKLYTLTEGKEDNDTNRKDIAADKGGEFTVKSVAQLSETTKPTMKLASSDDTTLTLTLGAPKTVVDAKTGTVLYEVTIKSNGAAKDTKDAATAQTNVTAALGSTGKTFYVPKQENALSQNAKFTVNSAAEGSGDAWKYDVSVKMIQVKEDIQTQVESTGTTVNQIGAESFTAVTGNKPFETKAPYYEDKLKLKKGTTTIYTGQQESADKKGENVDANGVLIATAQFGKNTTHTKIVKVEDLSYENQYGGALDVKNVGDKIYAKAYTSEASVDEMNIDYTALGKHKIAVYAEADSGMHKSQAVLDVTVVQGIENLKISVPTTSVYKTDKKAASFKATVDYNPGSRFTKAFAAKTKKVNWSIVDASGSDITEGSALNLVKVKNGAVTIDAKFVVSSSDETENKFRVKVTAADYYGNTTEKMSDVITITEQPQEIGDLVLAKEISDDNYEVLARNGDSVTAKELTDAQLFVLKRGTPEKGFALGDALDARNFDFKSGNKAVVLSTETVQDEYGDNVGRKINVRVDKPANKVKLTATANDGSRQKAEMTLNVNFDQVSEDELGLFIYTQQPSYQENKPADETAEISFDGTTSTEYYAEVVKKNGNSWDKISDYTDFKVSAKNAKFIANGKYGENVTFVNTSNKAAEITLTYSVPKANGKGFDKKTRTYKVTNTGFAKAKAPKVQLSGGLTAGGNDYHQTVTGKITLDRSMSDYSFKNKEVRVDLDWTKINSKNYSDYMRLANHLRDTYVDLESGKLIMSFGLTETNDDTGEEYEYTNIPAGSYSLKVTFGSRNYDSDTPWGEFVPDCQAASVTLKAAARKVQKGSFKPTAAYTLSLLDSSVELTGKGSNVSSVTFGTTLTNDNIKGVPNRFNEFFMVNEDSTDEDNHKYYLQLKSSAIAAELAKPENAGKKLSEIIPKEDLTGYVDYSALVGADQLGYPTEVKDTVKITVKLKDRAANKDDSVVKYAAANTSVLGGLAGVQAEIRITADKKPASIDYAYAVDTTANDEFKAESAYDDIVTLTSAKVPTLGQHSIELYVVPSGTYWSGAIYNMTQGDSETQDAFNARVNQVIKDNGVKLAVKVIVEDPAAKTGKIKLSGTNVVFTNDQYADDGSGNYWVEIPYTKVLDCEIDEIKVKDNDTSLIKDIIYFDDDVVYDENVDVTGSIIRACINKKELTDAIAASNNLLKWEQKNISVKTTVTFKHGNVGDVDYGTEKKAEDITFKVTLPKKPAVEMTFTEIVDEVKANTETIMDVELPDDWNALNGDETDEYGYTERDYVCNDVKWQIYENIQKYAPSDSDVRILVGEDVNEGYTYTEATTAAEGSLVIPVTLVDLTTATPEKDEQGNFTGWNIENATKTELESELGAGGYKFVIPKKSLPANDSTVWNKVDELMTGLNASDEITVSNETNDADIRAYLLKGAKTVLGADLVLWVETTDDDGENGFTPATDNADGKIIVRVIVQNRKGGEPFEKVYNTKDGSEAYVKIPKLATVTELTTAIPTALADTTKFKATNSTTQADVEAAIEEIIAEKNPDVTFAWAKKAGTEDDDYTFTAARIPHDADADNNIEADDGEGSITGKILLTNESSAADDNSGKCSFTITIEPLKKSDEAIAAVKAAAIGQDKAEKFAESNVEKTVKEAVLEAARDAVKNDPYVVDFKKDGENEVFHFDPVKWNEDGSISYTLEVKVKNADGTAGDVVTDTGNDLVQAAVTLAKNPALMATADAKTAIAAELAKVDLTWQVANTDTETEALGKVKTQLERYLPTGSGITVTVTKVSFEPATVKKAGTLVCSWKVEKGEESASGDANITIDIEMIAQTKAEAAAAAKTAGEKVKVANADFATADATSTKQTAIVAAVKTAVADKFTVEVRTDLTRNTEPTLNAEGTASIVFSIKDGAEDSSPTDVTCSYELPALEQTLAEAKTAADAAVKAYTPQKVDADKDAIITEINKVIKTSKFTAAWGEGEGKAFKLTPSAAAGEGTDATPGSITGEIVISETGTTNSETITVNITWEHTTA